MFLKNLGGWVVLMVFISANPAFSQVQKHISEVEEIRFSFDRFDLVGNLYLPAGTDKNEGDDKHALMIWVHGDGPDFRTGRFPDTSFFNRFLEHGYAYFRYDKPGSGDSKGAFTDSLLFQERAGIVSAAVEKLKHHPRIDASNVGLAGSSQAGYVMPLVLTMRNDLSFMVGLSLPAMSGNEQWTYLLKKQLICEGYSLEFAEEFSSMHLKLIRSSSSDEFWEIAAYFEKNPVQIPSLNGYDEDFATRIRNWWPLDWVQHQEFDPMEIIAETKIPVLSLYGANDTQVNPFQGAEAYHQRLQEADNPFYEIKILPDADHNMRFSETGCLKEQSTRTSSHVVPELSGILDSWLGKLQKN